MLTQRQRRAQYVKISKQVVAILVLFIWVYAQARGHAWHLSLRLVIGSMIGALVTIVLMRIFLHLFAPQEPPD